MKFLLSIKTMLAALLLSSTLAYADYAAFDDDNDGLLDENEYVGYSYDVIDSDDDDRLGSDEWNDYSSVWYEPFDNVDNDSDFGVFDADNDGYIDQGEYADNYDSDLFGAWDTDNSGYVDDNEYEEIATLYDDADEDGIFDF